MTPAVAPPRKAQLLWLTIAWFGLLMRQWNHDRDMAHGFFVPLIAGFIVWQRRDELALVKAEPNPWGLVLIGIGAVQLILGTLGAELFTARLSLVVTLIGVVWFLGGTVMLKKLAFPLFLLFFMIPIPAIIYSTLTLKLQIFASKLADEALTLLVIPVYREGNILDLPNQRLSVVEACSGIRSLLSLTFLSLVYGYF